MSLSNIDFEFESVIKRCQNGETTTINSGDGDGYLTLYMKDIRFPSQFSGIYHGVPHMK